jgi:hypothetical protein
MPSRMTIGASANAVERIRAMFGETLLLETVIQHHASEMAS